MIVSMIFLHPWSWAWSYYIRDREHDLTTFMIVSTIFLHSWSWAWSYYIHDREHDLSTFMIVSMIFLHSWSWAWSFYIHDRERDLTTFMIVSTIFLHSWSWAWSFYIHDREHVIFHRSTKSKSNYYRQSHDGMSIFPDGLPSDHINCFGTRSFVIPPGYVDVSLFKRKLLAFILKYQVWRRWPPWIYNTLLPDHLRSSICAWRSRIKFVSIGWPVSTYYDWSFSSFMLEDVDSIHRFSHISSKPQMVLFWL